MTGIRAEVFEVVKQLVLSEKLILRQNFGGSIDFCSEKQIKETPSSLCITSKNVTLLNLYTDIHYDFKKEINVKGYPTINNLAYPAYKVDIPPLKKLKNHLGELAQYVKEVHVHNGDFCGLSVHVHFEIDVSENKLYIILKKIFKNFSEWEGDL